MKKDKKQIEKRNFPTNMEYREDGDDKTLIGVASVTGTYYNMGWYEEKIEKGAFEHALVDSDTRCLKNHSIHHLLGRRSSNTLIIEEKRDGLHYKCILPDTQVGIDTGKELERGDLKESSFAFTIDESDWREEKEGDEVKYYFDIKKIGYLYDVGPVTYPANPEASAGIRSESIKRSFDAWQTDKKPKKVEDKRAAILRQRILNSRKNEYKH